MGDRGVLVIVVLEQLFLALLALSVAAITAEVAGMLFIPALYHATFSQVLGAAGSAPPIRIVAYDVDYLRIYGAVTGALVAGLLILFLLVRHIGVAKALKLGE